MSDTAGPPSRSALVDRWYVLTRTVLPAMARGHRWPISLDHCFMRVCLDEAVGRPWTEVIARPAVRHASDAELRRAVEIAESIVADPARLPVLNARSLQGRRIAMVRTRSAT